MKGTTNQTVTATGPTVPQLDLTKYGKSPFVVAAVQHVAKTAAALPTAKYTEAQLDGIECAICGRDLAYADGQRDYTTPEGLHLDACAPQCSNAPTSAPQVTVEGTDLRNEAALALYDSRTRIVLGIDFARPASEIADGLDKVLKEAFGSGRWVRHDTKATPADLATKYVRTAVSAELNGLDTHPRVTADQLHRVIDDESARYLAKVTGSSIGWARSAEAFSTATRAMEDALAFSGDRAATVRALQTALKMLAKDSR